MFLSSDALSDCLVDFWTSPAPKVTRLLPADDPLPRERTAHVFLIQLFWETQRIADYASLFLGSGDLSPARAAQDCAGPFLQAYHQTERALANGLFDAQARESLREIPSCFRKVAAYHDAVYARFADELEKSKRALQRTSLKLSHAIDRPDGEALLAFYPYDAPILYDDGETDIPLPQGNVYPLVRRKMTRALEEEAAKNGLILFHKATPIEKLNAQIDQAEALTNRSGPLQNALTLFAEDLQFVLEQGQWPRHPEKTSKLVAFPEGGFSPNRPRRHLKPKTNNVMPLRSPPPSWPPAP